MSNCSYDCKNDYYPRAYKFTDEWETLIRARLLATCTETVLF